MIKWRSIIAQETDQDQSMRGIEVAVAFVAIIAAAILAFAR